MVRDGDIGTERCISQPLSLGAPTRTDCKEEHILLSSTEGLLNSCWNPTEFVAKGSILGFTDILATSQSTHGQQVWEVQEPV